MSETQLFIANVNAVMGAKHLSISQVARSSGIDRTGLSKLLNGHDGFAGCTLERSGKIAKAIGERLSDLLAGPIDEAAAT